MTPVNCVHIVDGNGFERGYDLAPVRIEHICDVLPFHQSIYGLIKIQRRSIRVLCSYNGGQMVVFDCVVKFRLLEMLEVKLDFDQSAFANGSFSFTDLTGCFCQI